jgi:hypothetical protein
MAIPATCTVTVNNQVRAFALRRLGEVPAQSWPLKLP